MPTIYVIAGPNGVGKTTFANRYLPEEIRQLEFVNADLIARGLSPFDPESVSVEAGRFALMRIRQLIQGRSSFTWETTLSGRTAVVWLRDAKAAGYVVRGYFLWVRDVEVTLQRIRRRVIEGGHNIPIEVSRRRFFKTIRNFFELYRSLLDDWKMIENNEDSRRLVAVEKCGRLAVRDAKRFDFILSEAGIIL
jgi:predicted ABC-type ATPase